MHLNLHYELMALNHIFHSVHMKFGFFLILVLQTFLASFSMAFKSNSGAAIPPPPPHSKSRNEASRNTALPTFRNRPAPAFKGMNMNIKWMMKLIADECYDASYG